MAWYDAILGGSSKMVTAEEALPGRDTPLRVPADHYVNGHAIKPPFPDGMATAVFGMGCFWGAEKEFWELGGVWSTAVGYAGGWTKNPTYEENCTGRTGQTESVLVVFDPEQITYDELLVQFWENHDPTQGMRQGADRGSQYRSAIFATDEEQLTKALATKAAFQENLTKAGYGEITTEIALLTEAGDGEFYYGEDYHQQYLAKNPHGYCPVHATGVSCPTGLGVKTANQTIAQQDVIPPR